jgi:guanylate kinase
MIFVISAPSGAGKTTVIREIFKVFPNINFSVSATTRDKRNDEQNGKDYYFISEDEFNKKMKNDEFIEWEEVHGHLYGTLKSELKKGETQDILLDVDVKGAISIKKLYPQTVTIFIEAPREEMIDRLKRRRTEDEKEMMKRIARIDLELGYRKDFDHVVMNKSSDEGVKEALNKIVNIINKYKLN